MTRVKVLHWHGDSQAANAFANSLASEAAPFVLGRMLSQAGHDFVERNSSLGGSSSGGYGLSGLQRVHLLGSPDVAVFGHGYNDIPNGIVQATSKLNIRLHILSAKFGVMGLARRHGGEDAIYYGTDLSTGVHVAAPSNLPANGRPGQRMLVVADSDTVGGVMAPGQTAYGDRGSMWDNHLLPTLGGTLAGSPPTVWECRHPIAGVYGWGRVAKSDTMPTHVRRIVVESIGFLNIIGGDNKTLSFPGLISSGSYAGYEMTRQAQKDAVTAEALTVGGAPGVIFVDQYSFLRSRINNGLDVDDSAGYTAARSWHRSSGNQHYRHYGHKLRAENMCAEILSNFTAEGVWLA